MMNPDVVRFIIFCDSLPRWQVPAGCREAGLHNTSHSVVVNRQALFFVVVPFPLEATVLLCAVSGE